MRRFVTWGLFALLLAGCASHDGRDVPGIKNFGKVSSDVWRGGKPDRQGMQTLAQMGVKTIIDLQMDDESADVPPGVHYVPMRVSLWQCDKVDCEAVVKAIADSPKPVFVHCLLGRDRTGLAIAAWRLTQGVMLEDVMAELDSFGVNGIWSGAIKERIRRLYKEKILSKYAQDSRANAVQ